MTKITAIIPTLNEEDNIQRALNSVSFADEIIVIDSFSTDKTVEIVNNTKNVRLLQRKFDDFSNQKNYAIQQATHDWIFLLDADEEVTQELRKEIIDAFYKTSDFSAFYIKRAMFFKEKRIYFSGFQNSKVKRLFLKSSCVYKGKVHEILQCKGSIGTLKNRLNHYSFKNTTQYRNKLEHYAKLQAQELFEKGKRVTLFHLYVKPLARFFIQFFIKLGFLDGWRGAVISFTHSFGVFLRYKEFLKLRKSNYIHQRKSTNGNLIIGYDAKRLFHNTTGLGNYSRDLVRILSEFYPENEYVLYNPRPKKVHRLELSSNMKEVLPNSKIWKKFSSIWRQKPISKQITNDGIEIFHGLSGELPRELNSKIKKVVTIHDLIFVRYPELYSYFDRKIHFKKFKYACTVADKIIAISEQTKRDIIEFLKIDASKIEVIYQGCHNIFKETIPQEEREAVLQKYNLPKHFILSVGTVEERKNVLSIVKAIKNIDTKLVVVGRKTKYYQQIKKFIEVNSMEYKVFFLEGLTLREIASLYQSALIKVYPSIFEGFGIPIIESLYSKTPVITSKGGVFPEAGGPNSVYIDSTNIKELKNAIECLLSSEEKRNEIANKGFEFVQKFNDKSIADNLMKLYTKTLAHDKKKIIIDVERMKYPNTGLHNYCKNLAKNLSQTNTFDYTFFAPKDVKIPYNVKRINTRLVNKFFLKPNYKYSLWHGTYQTTSYIPKKPIKFILTIHDLNFLYEKTSKSKIEKLLKKVQKAINRADYITVISNFVLNDVKKHLNLNNKKVKVVYNGVNLVAYPNFQTPNYIPVNDFLFTIGTVLPKKNVHVLVKLLKRNSFDLLIAGIQPDKDYLELIKNEANKLKVLDRVKFLGAISEEEKYWYMNNCKAFVFPSIAEGFGLPVIEAMQLGKPVFLSTYTSLPEIGGKHAYYFTNFEEDEMLSTLNDGLADYKNNNKKTQIIEWASQFTWQKAIENYNEVYSEVLL